MSRPSLSAALAFLLVLTACVPDASQTPSPEPTPTETPEPTVSLVWETEESPIGNPWVGEDVVVSYIRTDTGMALAGFDPATGEKKWWRPAMPPEKPSSYGFLSADTRIIPEVIAYKNRLWTATLNQAEDQLARIVLLDAASGELQPLKNERVWPASRLMDCSTHTSAAFCLWAVPAGEVYVEQLRVSLEDPTVALDSLWPDTRTTKMLTPEIFVGNGIKEETSEEIGLVADSRVQWSHLYHDLFGKRTSPNAAWRWFSADGNDPVVGEGRVYNKKSKADSRRLADVSLVALDRETGSILWKSQATDSCDFPVDNYSMDRGVFVACHYSSGKRKPAHTEAEEPYIRYDDGAGSLVGLDLKTGSKLWEHPLTSAVLSEKGRTWDFTGTGSTLPLPISEGVVSAIDLRTGEATQPSPDDVFVCERHREDFEFTWSEEHSTYSAGAGLYPCDQSGAELPDWTASQVEQAGRLAGEVHVISMPDRLIGVRVA